MTYKTAFKGHKYTHTASYDPHDIRLVDIISPYPLDLPKNDAGMRIPALVGIAFDDAVRGRKGAKEGPHEIRARFDQIKLFDSYNQVDMSQVTLYDMGNMLLEHSSAHTAVHTQEQLTLESMAIRATHNKISDAIQFVADQSLIPISLGGDHSITYPLVKGLSRAHKGARIGLINIDAHLDLREIIEGSISSGTPFRFLIEEKILSGSDFFEIAMRKFANSKYYYDYARDQGIHIITMDDIRSHGMKYYIEEIIIPHLTSQVDMLYITIDMDGLDQSIAPGVSAPTPDGIAVADVSYLLNTLVSLIPLMGIDIVETNPRFDIDNMTSKIAAHFVADVVSALHQVF